MSKPIIVDSQMHLWLEESVERPWVPNGRDYSQGAPMTPEAAIKRMDEAGVDRVVIVPPSWEGDRNDYALEAVRRYPNRFGVMGRMDISNAGDPELFRTWRNLKTGMLGFRVTARPWFPKTFLTDGTIDAFWKNAAEFSIPVYVFFPGLTKEVGEVARRFPTLRLVIDHLHLNRLYRTYETDAVVNETMTLAQYPNVAVKVSSLPGYTDDVYPHPHVQSWVLQAVKNFGAERVFWGSDYTKLRATYRENVQIFTDELPTLTTGERELILGKGLMDWLAWP